ncbi:MAG TPA: hypothetical protein VMM93_13040 [Vicinamibacterales bacterium]|nr:hypothetical protein [Vicinamibacterales bacterium]
MRRAAAALALGALVLLAGGRAHDRITTRVTWSGDIAPIVERQCVGCHRPGGAAPMSLATYADARPWARAMRAEVVARRMPVWHAARGIGQFRNDRSLSPFEAMLIRAWADGGAPEGGPRRSGLAEITTLADTSVRLPRRARPPAGETTTVEIPLRLPRDRWMTAWRFFPNDPAIIQADFALAGGRPLASWVPPDTWIGLPEGSGALLSADATIVARLSHRSARLQQDFPVGLPALPPVLALTTVGKRPRFTRESIELRCGTTAAPAVGWLVSVQPLVAPSGTAVGVALSYADAPPIPVVRVRTFDANYRATYRLRDPIAFRPGATFVVESGAADCAVRLDVIR